MFTANGYSQAGKALDTDQPRLYSTKHPDNWVGKTLMAKETHMLLTLLHKLLAAGEE